ncbi:DUF6174 domain-containing protein [Actinoplanes sp. URMC 104]|uniref:DUF6174 domain-containing protein n=1 Tax=Actinoplanes sp. URMC 104 TaxID=3423409 RepID=UPI003F19B685
MSSHVRRWAASAAVVGVLAGCDGPQEHEAALSWEEPAAYTYELDSQCGERALIGRYRITVRDGRVTHAEGLDEPARRTVADSPSDTIPTLGRLADELDEARRAGADVARIETDPADGHPTRITIDPAENSTDDESCYTVTAFERG